MRKLVLGMICTALLLVTAISCGSNHGEEVTGAEITPRNGEVPKETDVAAEDEFTVNELLDVAIAAYKAEDLPTIKYYRSTAVEGDDDYIEHGEVGLIFYDEYDADVPVFDALISYAMATPIGNRAFEIDIFQVKDDSGLADAEAMLHARYDRKNNGDLANYAPEEDKLLKKTEYYTISNYVIMLSTHDNAVGIEAIKAAMGR